MQIEQLRVKPEHLLLDPNNYRFHDVTGYRPVMNRNRYAEVGVQERALQLLQTTESFDLDALKDSVATNGYVPLEQIVVTLYDNLNGVARYLIIEGNRRVAAVKTLHKEYVAGAVDIEDDKLQTLSELPVIEIIGSEEEQRNYQKTLMAIRHVAGIREWGSYQQARLIVELYENDVNSFSKVAQKIGISSREVARRYRASKALQQMEEDEEFGENAHPKLYTFFHEAMAQPKLREWLGFSDETYRAENEQNRRAFYELLSPRPVEGETLPAKLQNSYRQVRQLKEIVDKPIPLKILLDPERSFDDAVRTAEEENTENEAGILEHSLAVAYQSLKSPGIDQWLEPTERACEIWSELVKVVDKIRPLMERR
jgi:hypothetical protein